MQQTTVVLGLEDHALQEEVLHFLEREPRVRVVGAAHVGQELARRVRDERPDAAVVSPRLLDEPVELNGAALLVVAERETTSVLRRAIAAGARGFYLWPEERESLGRDTGRLRRPPDQHRREPGRVLAVYGARGGAGATFLATNLAAACARLGAQPLLLDLDVEFADVTAALGWGAKSPEAGGLGDLVPVLDELEAEHLDRVVQQHDAGFTVLAAPTAPIPPIQSSQVAALVGVGGSRFDPVILHLARTLEPATLAALESADAVLLVVTLDVMALRDAKRVVDVLSSQGLGDRCRLVVNRAVRGEVIPQDVEQVLGLPPSAVIRFDRLVPRSQNRGELVVGRSGRAARAVTALARRLLDEEGRP